MKHPLNRFGKRNRNIITGMLVGAASLFLLVYYLEIPVSEVVRVGIAVVVFIVFIMVAAIAFVALIKSVGRLLSRNAEDKEDKDGDHTAEDRGDRL